MPDIPLVDLSLAGGPRRDTVIGQIDAAFREIGFVYLSEHGIPAHTVESIRAAVIAYFDRSTSEKGRDRITRDNYRGYIPTGFFTANSGGGDADNYEGYKLHLETDPRDPIVAECDLYGPNRWPAAPKRFREAVMNYWLACDRVADTLLEIAATILGIDRKWFLDLFEKPMTNMTLLHYPPADSRLNSCGIHPHKDTDAFTILAGDNVSGLMVRRRGGDQWIEARPPAGSLVVNLGDLLELWSGGYFVSTPHKVVDISGKDRYSFPYFLVPRFDTIVEPLRKPVDGFNRAPVHVGDVSREVWRTNWPDAEQKDGSYDLGTLHD
ncbi:MAG: isopenicillin N synthase family oxygenase [Gammaproteobacteria bacterium]|nr:isopenicillin N synthase family oxygenase [Gammaproteobacteria bacterium]